MCLASLGCMCCSSLPPLFCVFLMCYFAFSGWGREGGLCVRVPGQQLALCSSSYSVGQRACSSVCTYSCSCSPFSAAPTPRSAAFAPANALLLITCSSPVWRPGQQLAPLALLGSARVPQRAPAPAPARHVCAPCSAAFAPAIACSVILCTYCNHTSIHIESCTLIYAYMHTYTYIPYAYMHAHMYISTWTYIYSFIHCYIYMHTHTLDIYIDIMHMLQSHIHTHWIMCIDICIYTYIHTYEHTYITYAYTHVHSLMDIHIFIHTLLHAYTHIWLQWYTYKFYKHTSFPENMHRQIHVINPYNVTHIYIHMPSMMIHV